MRDVLYKQRLITPFASPATETVCPWTFTGLNPGSVWGQFQKAGTSYTEETHSPLYHVKLYIWVAAEIPSSRAAL